MRSVLGCAVGTLIVFVCASPGLALTTTYTDPTLFGAALPGPASTETFEGLTAGTLIPSGSSVGDITFSYSLAPDKLAVTDAFSTTSGTNSLGLDNLDQALLDGDVLDLTLASPVLAMGLYVLSRPI
jgi:hypothetical protein